MCVWHDLILIFLRVHRQNLTFRKFIRIYEVIPLEESEVELEELDNTHNVSAQSSHPEDKVRLNYRWIDGLIGGKMGSVDGWVDRIE